MGRDLEPDVTQWSVGAQVEYVRQRLKERESNVKERWLAVRALHELETRTQVSVDDLRWVNEFFGLGLESRHDPEIWHGGDETEISRCRVCRLARMLR